MVGGGNSAGQGAMYLSKFAENVHIVIRKNDLSSSMSQYLIDQIAATENISILGETVVKEVLGKEDRMEHLVLEDITTGKCRKVDASALFVFIGAKPCTNWMGAEFLRNDKGFLETGRSLLQVEGFKRKWKMDREPFLLETSVPGVFAAGDVRAGAMNRVASAVGEGAMAIKFVHEYLALS
jgi:thioredoxin reductase (NADPH)